MRRCFYPGTAVFTGKGRSFRAWFTSGDFWQSLFASGRNTSLIPRLAKSKIYLLTIFVVNKNHEYVLDISPIMRPLSQDYDAGNAIHSVPMS